MSTLQKDRKLLESAGFNRCGIYMISLDSLLCCTSTEHYSIRVVDPLNFCPTLFGTNSLCESLQHCFVYL